MNSSLQLLSIIIPHLNQPEALACCLASLAKQGHDMSGVEIIVVDNGSDEMPDSVCRNFPDVRLEHEPEPGPGPARNRGIAVSTGEILAFIDADCVADENWVCTVCDEFAGERNDIVGGDVRIALADPADPTMLEAYESIFAYRQKEYIERQGFSGTGNLAMRRAVYETIGPFAGIEIAEDRDWGQRATGLGFPTRYVPRMIVYHPARRDMSELRAKWDRHVSHDFAAKARGRFGRLRWIGLIGATFLSPLAGIPRILFSDRVTSWRERRLAMVVLLRIRAYRALRMADILFRGRAGRTAGSWNRT